MAPRSTPTGVKRSRADFDSGRASPSPTPTSLKKPRLDNTLSPTTPKALHAIASAITGALGFPKRPSALKEVDNSYEVPDSDEEREKLKRKVVPKKPVQKENRNPNTICDVPDSGDEERCSRGREDIVDEARNFEGTRDALEPVGRSCVARY